MNLPSGGKKQRINDFLKKEIRWKRSKVIQGNYNLIHFFNTYWPIWLNKSLNYLHRFFKELPADEEDTLPEFSPYIFWSHIELQSYVYSYFRKLVSHSAKKASAPEIIISASFLPISGRSP